MLEELGSVVISFQYVHSFRTSVATVQRYNTARGKSVVLYPRILRISALSAREQSVK